MRTKIFRLAPVFLLPIIALFFHSCMKEEILPASGINDVFSEASKDAYSESTKLVSTSEQSFMNDFELNNLSLEEAIKSIEFEAHPDWKVAIKATSCVRGGQSLLVYNPEEPDPNFYDPRRFVVYWFKDGRPIRGTNRLSCVCRGKYTAVVILKSTGNGVGSTFYSILRACHFDKVAHTNF